MSFSPSLLAIPALVATLPVVPRTDATALLTRRLGLSATQQTEVRAILAGHHGALLAKADAFHDNRRKLVDACLDANASPERLQELHAKVTATSLALLYEVHATVQDLDRVLTSEQQAKALGFIDEAQTRFDGLRDYFLGR